VQFSSSNFIVNTSGALHNITSSATINISSGNVPIGVWQISGGVVINRGSGTFGVGGLQLVIITISSGSGTLSTLAMLFPITSSTINQIVCPMITSTLVANSVCTINFALQTTMSTYSGTTGYITFMFTKIGEVGGSGVSLNTNNTFTGNNTFPGLTTTGRITLPTTYPILPTTTQLGGTGISTFVNNTLTTNYIIRLGSIALPGPGVYLIQLTVSFTIGAAGGTMTRFVIEATTNANTFTNNSSMSTQYGSWTLANGQQQRYTTAYIHSSTTTDTMYGLCLFSYSGTAVGAGSITYVRIA
jgi:hypothetical protein